MGGIIPDRYKLLNGLLNKSAMLSAAEGVNQEEVQETQLKGSPSTKDPEPDLATQTDDTEDEDTTGARTHSCLYCSCEDEDHGTINDLGNYIAQPTDRGDISKFHIVFNCIFTYRKTDEKFVKSLPEAWPDENKDARQVPWESHLYHLYLVVIHHW